MKECTKCHVKKDTKQFYGKESRCVPCVNTLRREIYKQNPKKYIDRVAKYRTSNPEKIRDTKLKQAYGVGVNYYNEKLAEQNGTCAGCKKLRKNTWKGREVNMALDHDHKTGFPRGILCIKCNRALGLLEENIETFINLVNYINKYKKLG